jgi:hypothetical protein
MFGSRKAIYLFGSKSSPLLLSGFQALLCLTAGPPVQWKIFLNYVNKVIDN